MNSLLLVHAATFALATIACLGSLVRVQKISHAKTRRGLFLFLSTSGLWAGANLGFLLLPSPTVKVAFYMAGLVAGLVSVVAWLYFCVAYTGRSVHQLPMRRVVLGIIVALIGLKLTNPIHGLYFTSELATSPFPHLAIHHGIFHWIALGFAYALASVGFFMLFEHFNQSGTETRSLAVLVGLTALPVGVNILGVISPWILAITYEPIGVAVFALGTLFVYFDQFQTVHLAGELDDPIIFVDQDDQIRDYNRIASEVFPELAESIGTPIGTVLPELIGPDGEISATVERQREGDTKYYSVTTNPFMAGTTQTGRSLIFADVTETRRYQRQLEKKSEQLEALNRVVRHDIRNDMTVVLAWAEELKSHVDDDGIDALDRILRSAEHTVELTKVAHDFVESLTGDEQLDMEPIDLGGQLRAELDTARHAYPDVQFDPPETIPSVTVQANEMLSSVFRNILNNAVQHNRTETPEIAVRVDETAHTVIVRIADNGPGIPDDQKDSIFGKGQKGLDSEGTGIGLYLVQTLVEQFDGSVRVDDNDPTGAIFTIELPKTTTETESVEPDNVSP